MPHFIKIKPSPFLAHFFSTAGASLATALSNIFVLRFLTQGLGSESFGLYSLSNRAFSIMAPLSGMMMGLAMSRNLSCTPNREEKSSYILAASCWVFLSVLFVWGIGVFFRGSLSAFFLGGPEHDLLWFATLCSVSSFVFYALLDGIYFGSSNIFKANLWQWFLGVIGPLAVAFWFRKGPVHQIVFSLAILYSLALIPLAFIWRENWKVQTQGGHLLRFMARLIAFSAPRIAGGWFLAALLLIAPLAASHFISYEEAGFLMLAQAVFRIAEMGTNAFAAVALSKAGFLIGEAQEDFLRERVRDLLEMLFHLGPYLAAHLFLWSEDLVILWLGNDYLAVALRMKILVLGMIPYFAYVVLKPMIEALEFKPVNVIHLAISCAVSLVSALPLARMAGGAGLALSTSLGFLVLGILTVSYFKEKNIAGRKIPLLILINAALVSAAYLMQFWLRSWPVAPRVAAGMVFELMLAALYVYFLSGLKPRWLRELGERLIVHESSEGAHG